MWECGLCVGKELGGCWRSFPSVYFEEQKTDGSTLASSVGEGVNVDDLLAR